MYKWKVEETHDLKDLENKLNALSGDGWAIEFVTEVCPESDSYWTIMALKWEEEESDGGN